LLQYFYTIKDLRDAVLQLSRAEVDKVEDDDSKLTEDDLKKHRVGGRLVTLKEIRRSRRCKYLFTYHAHPLTEYSRQASW
jgi:ubiquitin carboxyl-terminal hydrolase 25/28